MVINVTLEKEELEKLVEEHSELLEEHGKILIKHGEQLILLDKSLAINEEKLKNIEIGQEDLKHFITENFNRFYQQLGTTNELLVKIVTNENDNKTKIEIAKNNNKTGIIKQGLLVIGSAFAGSKFDSIAEFIKGLFK